MVVRFGGLPAGVRRKAAVVPVCSRLLSFGFGPKSVEGQLREPYGRLALCRDGL